MKTLRPRRVLLAALFALSALSCSDSTQPTDTNTILVKDNEFVPATLTVTAGTTVTWSWVGTVAHHVVSDNGSFTESESQAVGTHTVVFNTAGTFNYHCTIHGTPTSGMRGTIVVQSDSLAVGGQ